MRQIILDTETTGLKPSDGHRIIEIGCVELINRELSGNNFHCYINPQREVDEGALKVHGIDHNFLADKPTFIEIVNGFLDYVKDAELIIHNAPFDVGFINHEFSLCRNRLKKIEDYCIIFDTLNYARKKHPGQRNSLDALCKRYNIDNSHRDLHGALLDAEILALVYLAMTAGQASLFGETISKHAIDADTTKNNKKINIEKKPQKIVYANAEELAEHEDYLKKLNENAEMVW